MTHMTDNQSIPKFYLVFLGQAFSLLGSRLVQFTLVWWLTSISGTASVLAFASIMAMIPQIIISPFAGAFVDRLNRKHVMIVADAFIALCVVILALLFHFELIQIWHVYALMLVRSVGEAFHFPAMQASTSLLVPEKLLIKVSGLNQSLQGIITMMAPVLGAIALEFLDIQQILAIDVFSAGIAIIPLLVTFIPQHSNIKTIDDQNILVDIREILNFMIKWKGGLIIILGAMLGNLLLTPAFALLPLLVTNYFERGVVELAWLQSAWGLGMILGGVLLGAWGGFKKRIITAMTATLIQGICLTAISLIPSEMMTLAVTLFFISGLMNPIINGSLFAIVQSNVPLEMQGRYFTMIMSGSGAMTPIGLAIAGPVSDLFGVKIWFFLGGLCFFILGVSSFFIKSIMEIEPYTPS